MVTVTPRVLMMFRDCPEQYFRWTQGEIPEKRTKASLFGEVAHALLLENKKPGAEAKLTPLEIEHLANMTRAFRAHGYAQNFLKAPRMTLHIPLCATLEGRTCEANIDCVDKDGDLWELKTTSDVTRFERYDVHDLGYLYELAFKRMILRAATGQVPTSSFLCAVEKTEPYRVGVFLVADGVLNEAEARVRIWLQDITACERRKHFPNYYEDFRTITVLK